MTLTKRDIVVRISSETGMTQEQVASVVQRVLDLIAEAIRAGDKVELRNFGVFEVKVRRARVGRNPNAPAVDVPIPQRSVARFKPGKLLRREVLKLTPAQSLPPVVAAPPAKVKRPRTQAATVAAPAAPPASPAPNGLPPQAPA